MKRLIPALLFGAVLGVIGGRVAAQPATSTAESIPLKFNHTDTPSGARHRAAELFARKVSEYTKGRYRVLVFHSGQLGNDPQSLAALAKGDLDFTVSATGSFAGQVKTLNLTALPYLVDNYEQGWRFYDQSPWLKAQFDLLPPKGMRVLATWEAGFRSFTTKTPLDSPSDAKGQKMRIFPNDMIRWIMESIGFVPEVIGVTDVYLAIQQGRVIGQENPVDTISALRFYEVAPVITLTQHVYSPIPFAIAEKTWARLPAADQVAITKAAQEAAAFCRQYVRTNELRQLADMEARGAKVKRLDATGLASFKAATKSVVERARKDYGPEVELVLRDAEAIRKQVGTR